jgi:hypothetical protein
MSDQPKSPRDWLLARHAGATPRLDELRRAALPTLTPSLTWREFFGELFRPHRLAWRTLAAVWIVLLVFHLALGRPSPSSKPTPAPAPEAMIAWFRQLQSHETLAHLDR